MTRTEAAEALYRAVEAFIEDHRYRIPYDSETLVDLRSAANVYLHSAATPSLPPAVQRVVEAALKLIADCQADLTRYLMPDSGVNERDVINNLLDRLDGPQWREVEALYRSSQPEPLSARLAKLGKGAVVTEEANSFVVLANIVEHQTLAVLYRERVNLLRYSDVDSILSESP